MNPRVWEIFRFVEIVFLIGIVINLVSYAIRFTLILSSKRTKIFLRTMKEGFSKKILVRNSLNLSLLITSISIFSYMLKISKDLKPLSIQGAYAHNPLLTGYVLIACLVLLIYSIIISILNIRKIKELTPVLGYLSLWNAADNLTNALGGGVILKPITEISTGFRKYLIQSKLSGILVSTLILVILEYVYKILIVLALLYLIKGNI